MPQEKLWMTGAQIGITFCRKEKSRQKTAAPPNARLRSSLVDSLGYVVSPSTVTLISTTTSVCSATLTVESPTVLIGPLGIRTCDLATL
jgi:hypothetical protein